MEFEIEYGKSVNHLIDCPLTRVELDSSFIHNSDRVIKPYIFYRIKVAGYVVNCIVNTEPIDEKYLIYFFMINGLKGLALDEFMDYLKKNHKKNVVELSL